MHLLLLLAAPVQVQAAPMVYTAAFYRPFSPNTALDMVAQTPGFVLAEGAERRGFAGAAGNVLIDGERPSAKATSLADLLAQIPAAQVERIEFIRAAESADASGGHAVVLNVVRKRAQTTGAWSVNAYKSERGHVGLGAGVSWTMPTPAGELALGLSRSLDYQANRGDRITGVPGGAPNLRYDWSPRDRPITAATAQLKRPFLAGPLRLNLRLHRIDYSNPNESRTVTPPILATTRVHDYEREDMGELGGDWERAFGSTRLRLVGVATRRRYTADIRQASFTVAGLPRGGQVQTRANDIGETIARAVLSRTFGRHRLEAGAEAALNTFDAHLTLDADTGGGLRPVVLPAANVRLEERRAEAFVSDSVEAGPWRLEATLAAETSRLAQSGDTQLETLLTYVKPSVQVSRNFASGAQARLRLYRDVAQLNFEDFVSFAAVLDDRVVGGNPNLRPQTRWRLEAGYDRRFGVKGAVSITAYRAWASDVADVVPLGGLVDAPGNIGDGDFWGASVKLTLPLDALMPGGLFSLQAEANESRVTDPTTGRARRASNLPTTSVRAQFRQDLAVWKGAWGASLDMPGTNAYYRRAEVDHYDYAGQWTLFAERAMTPRVKLRVNLVNLTDYQTLRRRTFYTPDRTGALSNYETRDRRRGRSLTVEMKGSF